MKYLILKYAESPVQTSFLPETFYCDSQNLNVLKSTGEAAIKHIDLKSTETFTKVFNEESDSDNNFLTQTITLVNQEATDDDTNGIRDALITMTTTKYEVENTDTD
ncbi:hypothetical protein ACK2M7_06815 [Chryseobacterium sp. TY4]